MYAIVVLVGLCFQNMVIWKERTHDDEDVAAERDPVCIAKLRNYGILKFFRTPSTVSHERLLEHILRIWNIEQQYFEVGAHILTVEVEDIYFLTGLSRRGAPILLTGSCGGDITTQELIDRHCILGTRTSRKKIPIKEVMDGPLRTILFAMQRVVGSQGVHWEFRAHMLYAIEAMAPTVFNWVEVMLPIFKDQLTKCQKGELKQFGFGSILACFFFERVPQMRPLQS